MPSKKGDSRNVIYETHVTTTNTLRNLFFIAIDVLKTTRNSNELVVPNAACAFNDGELLTLHVRCILYLAIVSARLRIIPFYKRRSKSIFKKNHVRVSFFLKAFNSLLGEKKNHANNYTIETLCVQITILSHDVKVIGYSYLVQNNMSVTHILR